MTRTSFVLPDTLYHRLTIAAKQDGMTVSALMRKLLDKALTRQEEKRINHMYTVLKELDGIGGDTITDASTTIDEVLYGEKGAWRGSGK